MTTVSREEPPTSGLELGGEILEISKGGKMPMAAFVTQLRHQQRERDVKNELMSVVNNNKTAASRQNFASFSFPLFQLNILIKL